MSTEEQDLSSGGAAEAGADNGAEDRAESAAIEAVLTVATDPVPPGLLAELLEVPVEHVEELCRRLAASYEADGRGFSLVRVAGGYRFQSSENYVAYVERFVLDGAPQKLSPAALETLAASPELAGYGYLSASRADFLRRLGRTGEARLAYEEALLLTGNAVERDFLAARLDQLGS